MDEVCAAYPPQFLLDFPSFFGLVPEEEHPLQQLVAGIMGAEYRFECIGVVTGVPHFGADGHWSRGEVLDLFQLEVEPLCGDCQFRHILLVAPRMTTDEIGDNLLFEIFLSVDLVEDALEFLEQLE